MSNTHNTPAIKNDNLKNVMSLFKCPLALPWAFECAVDYNSDRVVLLSMAAMARPDGIVITTYKNIVEISGCSSPTATRSIGRLLRRKHIELLSDTEYGRPYRYKLSIADAALDDIRRYNDAIEAFRKPIDPALLGDFL